MFENCYDCAATRAYWAWERRATQQEIIDARKEEYLRSLYEELIEENDERVIHEYYTDDTVEYYSIDEFVEQEINDLDDYNFDY